jgi:cytochrome c
MIKLLTVTATTLMLATPTFAADIAGGEKDFKSCKACHTITNGDEVIYKGGRTGPNLYGIIGRQAGSFEGYKYGDDIISAGENGLIWTESLLVDYVKDPKAFLTEQLGERARSKMSYKKKDASDIIAYLASVGPLAAEDDPTFMPTPELDPAQAQPSDDAAHTETGTQSAAE